MWKKFIRDRGIRSETVSSFSKVVQFVCIFFEEMEEVGVQNGSNEEDMKTHEETIILTESVACRSEEEKVENVKIISIGVSKEVCDVVSQETQYEFFTLGVTLQIQTKSNMKRILN